MTESALAAIGVESFEALALKGEVPGGGGTGTPQMEKHYYLLKPVLKFF